MHGVLIVDDDLDACEEYVTALADMGMKIVTATDGIGALARLAADSQIDVVVTDLRMPRMDGLAFVREMRLRFAGRVIRPIIVTGHADLESARIAMRFGTVELLVKPVSTHELVRAVSHAILLNERESFSRSFQLAASAQPPATPERTAVPAASGGGPEPAPRPQPFVETLRSDLRARRERDKIFGEEFASDVAWLMLVDLYISDVEGKEVSTTSLSLAGGAPLTTSLRVMGRMEEAGLIRRLQDNRDKRRVLVTLTPHARSLMSRYYRTMGARVGPAAAAAGEGTGGGPPPSPEDEPEAGAAG